MGKFEAIDEGNEVSVDSHTAQEKALVGWVMNRVKQGEDHRDQNHKDKWDEYYRLWRGIYKKTDSDRDSERSKLIAPALQQAIEAAVAEQEEAAFGKGKTWFDLDDDVRDEQKNDLVQLRMLLTEDFEEVDIKSDLSEALLNGALYGTGIAKLIVDEQQVKKLIPDPEFAKYGVRRPKLAEAVRFVVRAESVRPHEFAIDPAARNVDEAMWVAHTPIRPLHTIIDKQRQGVYIDRRVGEIIAAKGDDQEELSAQNQDAVRIVEYYGLVPASLLPVEVEEDEEVVEVLSPQDGAYSGRIDLEEEELVEAIITIANDSVLLRAVENKYLMKDRPFVVYQYDTVPGKFWGRGVAEKGYNPQKALDAELRARIDAMALAAHPMMAVDASRLPRAFNFKVRPGKVWPFTGPPRESFEVFNFGAGMNASTFHQSGELERMVQMGTGAMDSATPTNVNSRNQTASGMSMIESGAMKRSKRTLQNISRQFLSPFVTKAAYRYMQFDPERYPITDVKFKVVASMGIMAREYEQGQLTQLLSIVPPESPVFQVILEGIFENSSLENKAQLMQALEQMKRPSPIQQQQQQLQMQMAVLELKKAQAEVQEIMSKTVENYADANSKASSPELESFRAMTERMQAIDNILNALNGSKNNNNDD